MKKIFYIAGCLMLCILASLTLTSCSEEEPSNSIVGTWVCDNSTSSYTDVTTLVFKSDNSGTIQNEWGSRSIDKMVFDYSLTTQSNGEQLLTVIYKSGDQSVYPFASSTGTTVQWQRTVTVAGKTLSIKTSEGYVMLFKRK